MPKVVFIQDIGIVEPGNIHPTDFKRSETEIEVSDHVATLAIREGWALPFSVPPAAVAKETMETGPTGTAKPAPFSAPAPRSRRRKPKK